jgi:hypothetical protein
MVKLAKILIIKINPQDNSIASIAPWNGTNPGSDVALIVVGVKIANRTFDAYTDVPSLIAQKVKRLKSTEQGERTFDHLRTITETGAFVSCLYGCPANRKPLLYGSQSVWGMTEHLQSSLLPNIMTRTSRFTYNENGIFRVYVETDKDTESPTCWFSATGRDEWAEVPGYTKEVKLSELPSEIGDMGKNYRVLYNFNVGNVQDFLDMRLLGPNPFKRQKLGGDQKAGKSRRRLKRRNKRKTIKRRNKRKTIKRRFKKR